MFYFDSFYVNLFLVTLLVLTAPNKSFFPAIEIVTGRAANNCDLEMVPPTEELLVTDPVGLDIFDSHIPLS